jgi:hypothetical protein
LIKRLSVANQALSAPETGQAKFFHVVVATSTAVLACECVELFVATVARLNVVNCVVGQKTIVVLVINKFF